MMKKIIISICTTICFISVKASPQAPDYLIIGKDTVPVYQLILERYLQTLEQPTDNNSLFGFSFRDTFGSGISFSCWRGYQAVYSLENDSLFLKYILPCNDLKNTNSYVESSNEKMEMIFNDKVKNNKVLLDWYSGEFAIPKGKMIWWDDIFIRIYDEEKLYIFQNGILLEKTLINNYQKVEGGISRKKKEMSKAVFNEIKKLNWKKLDDDFLCDDTYCLEIDSRGKVINVKKNNYGIELDEDDIYCQEVIKNQLKNLQFDIIFYHGRPFNDRFCIQVFYDSTTNELENWSKYEDYDY